jgi:hypothetical protein
MMSIVKRLITEESVRPRRVRHCAGGHGAAAAAVVIADDVTTLWQNGQTAIESAIP